MVEALIGLHIDPATGGTNLIRRRECVRRNFCLELVTGTSQTSRRAVPGNQSKGPWGLGAGVAL